MISAAEAKELANKVREQGIKKEMEKIEMAINTAIRNGEYQTCIGGIFNKVTTDCLIKLGYQVEPRSQYNESYINIRWELA